MASDLMDSPAGEIGALRPTSERRLTAVEFQQLASVPAAVEVAEY